VRIPDFENPDFENPNLYSNTNRRSFGSHVGVPHLHLDLDLDLDLDLHMSGLVGVSC